MGDVVLECGHIMPRAMANRKTGWVHRSKPRVYCQVCAASPHPITNPEAWARMPAGPDRWWRRIVEVPIERKRAAA